MTMNLTYAVVGTGALGGYYGGKLANAGKDIHFLLNSDYEYVKEHGLKVDSVAGDFHLKSVNAYGQSKDMPQVDVVLVCLKTTQNHLLAELLPPLLKEDTIVLLVQNGIGLEAALEKQFPKLSVAGGLAFICSAKVGPGHINHQDYGQLNVGAFNFSDTERLEQLCADFNEAGVPCDFSKNLMLSRWQKLVWNAPFNGLTVVLNTTTDTIMQDEAARSLAKDIMHEVVAGAQAGGIPLETGFADKMMVLTERMKPYAPSMKLDYDFGRPLEVKAIYSQAIEAAAQHGFEMKKMQMLEQQLLFIDRQNMSK